MRISRSLVPAVVAATAMLSLGLSGVSASAVDTRDEMADAAFLTDDEALAIDAQSLATELGATFEEAASIIERQSLIGEVIPSITKALGDSNAGVSVDNPTSSTTLNVRVAGSTTKGALNALKLAAATLAPSGVSIKVAEGLPHSLVDLDAAATAIAEGLSGESGLIGISVEPELNGLVLDVTRPGVAANASTRLRMARSGQGPDIPIFERSVDSGGDEMFGGAPMSTCTTGFSVKNTAGQTGLLTAAHCDNSQSYATTSPYVDWYSSTFMSERLNSTTDIQWHRINPPHASAIGYFYGQSGSSVTKRTGSAVPYGGLYVCHRGRVSGYSCGTIGTDMYKPTYAGACGTQACAAVYCTVTAIGLKSEGGDSGGPWFMGGTSYGIHKGSIKSGSSRAAFFTPIQRLASAFPNLSLL